MMYSATICLLSCRKEKVFMIVLMLSLVATLHFMEEQDFTITEHHTSLFAVLQCRIYMFDTQLYNLDSLIQVTEINKT